jgi:hypothetical protein
LNDKFSKGIDIDLNDRIAFVKHLFGNSSEDYNRAQSVNHFDNFYETRNFIDEMVKPDYNNWEGKDDYAERFMDIIEKNSLNELQNTNKTRSLYHQRHSIFPPSNTNKIPAEPRMSKLYSSHANRKSRRHDL